MLWIKVYNITDKRLLGDMAKEGWSWDEDSDSDEDASQCGSEKSKSEVLEIPLYKIAVNLVNEAQEKRVRYRSPKIQLLLPRLVEGADKDIDKLLSMVRALGIMVMCGNDIPRPPQIDEALGHMVIDEFSTFTDTLNIDCSLLALVSDLSFSRVIEPSRLKKWWKEQQIEEKERLLPTLLWPAMGSRKLVCTRESAAWMRELVDMIGTETERARMRLLFSEDTSKSRQELIADFQRYSDHEVPSDWQLPIMIIDFDQSLKRKLPRVVAAVEAELTDHNRSVFLYGWATGITTLSSNKVVARLIEKIIWEHNRHGGDVDGPHVWLSRSRSLVAKPKPGHEVSEDSCF